MEKKLRLGLGIILVLGACCWSWVHTEQPFVNAQDPDNCLENINVPKRFTPNGDDTLDVFTIDFPCAPESFDIQLFDNATGELVFVSKKHTFEWNGLHKQTMHPCPSGVYDWKMSYTYHMKFVERKGQVLLLR